MSTASNAGRDRIPTALLNRRSFLAAATAAAGAALSGCTTMSMPQPDMATPARLLNQRFAGLYAAVPDERFPLPAIDVSKIDGKFLRQQVSYTTPERPGTIVIDPDSFFLYLVQEDGMAMRYGVGVGKEGFAWNGRAIIARKAAWPTWTPTPNMIRREPDLAEYAGGMAPGLENPLGARALYLHQNGRDTLYRIHGTNEPWSIGHALSSGCIRLFNQDIIDLHNRIPNGTPVVVLPSRPQLMASSAQSS